MKHMERGAYSEAQEALGNIYETHTDNEEAGKDAIVHMIHMLDSGEHPDADSKGIAHGAIGVWSMIRELGDPDQLIEVMNELKTCTGSMESIKDIGISVAMHELGRAAQKAKDIGILKEQLLAMSVDALSPATKKSIINTLISTGKKEGIQFIVENAAFSPADITEYFHTHQGTAGLATDLLGEMSLAEAVPMIHTLVDYSASSEWSAVDYTVWMAVKNEGAGPDEAISVLEQYPGCLTDSLSSDVCIQIVEKGSIQDIEKFMNLLKQEGGDSAKTVFADACSDTLHNSNIVDFYLAYASEEEQRTSHYITIARLKDNFAGLQE